MKPYVGTFLILKEDGTTDLHRQLYATKARPKPRLAKTHNADAPSPETPELTRRISDALAMQRRDVLALHVANDPALALDLALFQLALPLVTPHWRRQTGSTIAINDISDPLSRNQTPASHARSEIEKMAQALDTAWADEPSVSAAFLAFRAIDESVKATWLGLSVACSLKASLGTHGNFANPFHDALGCALGIDVADFWRPTAENYFDGLKKHAILGAIADFGDASIATRYAASKKSDLAKAAEKLCAGTVIVEPAVKERALAWLPPEMRFEQLPEAETAASPRDAEPDDASSDAAAQNDGMVTPEPSEDCEAELMAA
jgi:ParB family chromosome partitioning protein